MKSHRIAVISGDGVGPEIIAETKRVLEKLQSRHGFRLDYTDYDWGADYYFRHGRMSPEIFLDQLRRSEAILLGTLGHPKLPGNVPLTSLILPIRRAFDQYANVRPARLYPSIASPLVLSGGEQIDIVVVRENTEGEYAPVGGFVHQGHPEEAAVQSAVFTRTGVERVSRCALEIARKRGRQRRVTSITRSNVQGYGPALWDRTFTAIAEEYPDVRSELMQADTAARNLIRCPQTFDVIVGSNLFGDILSDIAVTITGSLGITPCANLDPSKRYPSMFQPMHGPRSELAGNGLANPIAAFRAGGAMLEHLGYGPACHDIERAVSSVLSSGHARTPDIGGQSTTRDVTSAVISEI